MRKINPAAPIAVLLLVNLMHFKQVRKKTADENINKKNYHFSCNNAQPLNLALEEQSCPYVGQSFCYRGMDSARGVFYLNDTTLPIKIDTLRMKMNSLSNVVNLFVVENITPDSLRIRTVGHDRP